MSFKLNKGEYVFCFVKELNMISSIDILCSFKEINGYSIIISKNTAISNSLKYDFISAWITFDTITHLDSIGITSLFSSALSNENISCNVVASLNNDHIFVPFKKRIKALEILNNLEI